VGEKTLPDQADDLLDVFKALVKSDPSWNTIRDNCRELVYYHNCIAMERLGCLAAESGKNGRAHAAPPVFIHENALHA